MKTYVKCSRCRKEAETIRENGFYASVYGVPKTWLKVYVSHHAQQKETDELALCDDCSPQFRQALADFMGLKTSHASI
jgi:hypothetical protein